MTVESSLSKAVFNGNGVTVEFPFTFKVWDVSELAVTMATPQGYAEDVTAAAVITLDEDFGGIVTYVLDNAPLPEGYKLAITRNMPFLQRVDLVSATRFDPQVMEDALDQACAERQQLREQLARAVIMPPTSETTPEEVVQSVYAARDAAAASATAASGSASEASGSAALAQAWAESPTPPDAGDADSKSARTWAGLAAGSADAAAASESNAADSADRAQAWAESPAPPDPEDPDSKSAKTWAAIAADTVPIATPTLAGKVRPDGASIEVAQDGGISVPAATTTTRGISRLATSAEVQAGTAAAGSPAPAVVAVGDMAPLNAAVESLETAVEELQVGSSSPVFGICRYATGGGSGTWFHVGEDEKSVVSLNEAYFNHHAVYGAISRVLVDGQVMNRMPKLWIKHTTPTEGVLAGKPVTMISPVQRDGYKVHPAFLLNAEEIPCFYLGCYKAGNLDNKAVSLPGYAPLVSINFATMQQRCEARNVNGVTGFMMQDVYQRSLLKLLMLAEFANPDMQNILGNGHVSGSAAVTVDNVANHKPWRNFHGVYGNVWEMVDGIRANGSRQAEIWRNDGTRAYVNTGLAMTVYGSGLTGWIVDMLDSEGSGYDMRDVYVPKSGNGTQTNGSYGDNHFGAVANGVCYEGGSWGYGTGAGLFCTGFDAVASLSSAVIGSRLAKV